MGGFGGALKQLSIGFASRAGKTNIHTGGTTQNYRAVWSNLASQIDFTTSMADAASTIVDYFKNKGSIAYINVLVNISKSCDCAGSSAPTPKIRNIGILSSLDPVAIDKACYDLIVKENNDGSKDWIKQAETKLGLNTLDKAVEELEIKIAKHDLLENKILFVRLEEEDQFPPELNGLVAMKLSAKYKKPTIVARLNNEGEIKGSSRGLNESELTSFKNFMDNSGYFTFTAGHDNACGIGILDKNLAAFHEYANKELANVDFGESWYEVNFERIAADSDIEDLIVDIANHEDIWGQGCPEPLIHIKDINITKHDIQIMGRNSDTVKITKFGIAYMKFHAKDFIEKLSKYDIIKLEVVGRANLNFFAGQCTPQIFISNYQIEDGTLGF